MKTFFIKMDGKLLEVTEGESSKDVVLEYADAHNINPFYLTAEETGTIKIREEFVKTTVAEYFERHYKDYTEDDIQGVKKNILDESQLWKMLDTLMHSYVVTYVGNKKSLPEQETKGRFVDLKI